MSLNLRVWGWLMPVMAAIDILGVLSTSVPNAIFLGSSTSSLFDTFVSDSSLHYASCVYNFFGLYFVWHLCLGSHLSLQQLHFPSFILWASKFILSSHMCGGMYLSLSVSVVCGPFFLEQALPNPDRNPSSLTNVAFALRLGILHDHIEEGPT